MDGICSRWMERRGILGDVGRFCAHIAKRNIYSNTPLTLLPGVSLRKLPYSLFPCSCTTSSVNGLHENVYTVPGNESTYSPFATRAVMIDMQPRALKFIIKPGTSKSEYTF